MWFKDELENILKEENLQIEKLEEIKDRKEKCFIQEFFEVNSRVEYKNRYGAKQGRVIAIDDNFRVVVMVDYFNGEKVDNIERFFAEDLFKINVDTLEKRGL